MHLWGINEAILAAVILSVTLASTQAHAVEPGCPGSSNPNPSILHCDDFDDGRAMSEKWNTYTSKEGGLVPIAGTGVDGSTAMRARHNAGQVSIGAFSIGLGRLPSYYLPGGGGENWKHVVSPQSRFRELYWREYIRFEAGWSGVRWKHSRVRILTPPEPTDPSGHRAAFQSHLWPDTRPTNSHPDGVMVIKSQRGVDENGVVFDRGNNSGTSIWLSKKHGRTVIYKDYPQGSGWLCIEAHIKLNDPGLANGIEEFWLDGQLEARLENQNHVENFTEYGLNQLVFDNYWNGGSPQVNVLYRDNMVVSTQRIGCRDSQPPANNRPNPPVLLPSLVPDPESYDFAPERFGQDGRSRLFAWLRYSAAGRQL